MKFSKRLLSLALCFIMAFGVFAIALSASADSPSTVLSYSELNSTYEGSDFVYLALRFYDDEGNELATGAQLSCGTTYNYSIYFKSNQTVYGASYLPIALDADLFDYTAAANGKITAAPSKIGVDNTSATYRNAFFKNQTGVAHSEIVASTGYSAEEVQSWGGLRLTLVSGNNNAEFKDDTPIFSGTATVKSDAVSGSALFDGSFFSNVVGTNYADAIAVMGRIALGARSNYPEITNFIIDAKYDFTTDKKFDVKYYDEAGATVLYSEQLSYGEAVSLPDIEGVYAWLYDGSIVTAAPTVTGDMNFYAVSDSTEVQVTFNANGGTIDGGASKTVPAAIGSGQIDLSALVPENGPEGAEFNGWKDANGNVYTDFYPLTSLDPVTLTAFWAGDINVYVQCITNTGTADAPVYETEYKILTTYKGEFGKPFSQDDYAGLVDACIEHQDEVPELTGLAALGFPVQYYSFDNVSNTHKFTSELLPGWRRTGNFYSYFSPKSVNSIYYAQQYLNQIIGSSEVLDELVLAVQTYVDIDAYVPAFDEDDMIIEDPDGAYGIQWETRQSFRVYYSSQCDGYAEVNSNSALVNPPEDFKFCSIKTNKSLTDTSRTIIASFNKDTQEFKVGGQLVDIDYRIYNFVLKDGNGSEVPMSNATNYDPRFSNLDAGKAHLSLYADLSYVTYYIGFTYKDGVDTKAVSSVNEFNFGDTITYDDFLTVTKFGVASGDIALSDLENADNSVYRGYKLSGIYYTNEDDERVEFTEETTIEVNEWFISKAARNESSSAGIKANEFVFEGYWVPEEYPVNFYYLDSSKNWVVGTTQIILGNSSVTYGAFVTPELEQTIRDNSPVDLTFSAGTLAKGDLNATETGNATYDSATLKSAFNLDKDGNGVYSVYAKYVTADRTAFVDYNNGFDQDGNPNEDKIGTSRVQTLLQRYGALLYDPNYDVNTAEPGQEVPIFDQYTRTAAIETMPAPTDTGDIKAETTERPYRDCEFIGFKVYYTDGIYSSFEDLPPQEEWKEGYNDRNEEGQQRLYTTTILQYQWKADSDFFFRVYDDSNTLMWALGRDFKTYYWRPYSDVSTAAVPATKADLVHCRKPDENVNILFLPKKDEVNGTWYFYHISIAKTWFNLTTYGNLLPVVVDLLKSGLIGQLLG